MSATATRPDSGGYRALLAVPGFARLAGGTLLARTGELTWEVVLVLLVLDRYGSATLAGIAVFLNIVPGMLVSPLAGALLDRGRRIALVVLDFAVSALALALLGALALGDRLPVALMLVIVAARSVTEPLSLTGTRSLFPLLLPPRLWDRGNAIDSAGYVGATLLGPALAGVLVALVGGPWAVLVTASLYALAAAVMVGVPAPAPGASSRRPLVADAWAGLLYVLSNPTLRGLAVVVSLANLGNGIVIVTLPVIVLDRLGGGPAAVGALWAVMGAAGLVSGLISGRLHTEDREAPILAAGTAVMAVGVAGLAVAPTLPVAGIAMAVGGLSNGPADVALFSVRQRRTDPEWLGRAFAVSLALNYLGTPVGSALAGPLLHLGTTAAAGVAAVAVMASAALTPRLVPRRGGAAPAPG